MPAPDWYNLIALERGLPEGWTWYSLSVLGGPKAPREHAALMVKGGVPGPRFKSGKNKGEINWSKAGDRLQMVITFRDLDARMERWERETGKCHKCGGDGRELAGHSVTNGATMRECSRCKGRGRP